MITISGASGDLGKRIANKIAELGNPKDFRLASRSPEKLAEFDSQGFDIATFDFDDPASMRGAMRGSDTVLIISGDSPVEVRVKQQRDAIAAAKEAGVKHVVYTSFTNPTTDSHFPFAAIHGDTEAAIKDSGLGYTILRNPMYAENIAGALQHAAATGQLALPGSEGKTTYLVKDDIAEATARVLLNKPTTNAIYNLSGSDAWTLADLAKIASEKWDKSVTASEMPYEAFGRMLTGFGLPSFLVEALKGIHAACGAGEYSATSKDTETLLGRKPTDIGDFIASISA